VKHPIPNGTRVIALYRGCKTCAPNHIDKISTRTASSREEDGKYFYTLLDGREVSETDILEVK
jgi:hypothetical protein